MGVWSPRLLRVFNDWDLEQVYSLINYVHSQRIQTDRKDRLVWKAFKTGIFSVKSLYGILEDSREEQFPRKLIWDPCIPTKAGFFAWEVWWGEGFDYESISEKGSFPSQQVP